MGRNSYDECGVIRDNICDLFGDKVEILQEKIAQVSIYIHFNLYIRHNKYYKSRIWILVLESVSYSIHINLQENILIYWCEENMFCPLLDTMDITVRH